MGCNRGLLTHGVLVGDNCSYSITMGQMRHRAQLWPEDSLGHGEERWLGSYRLHEEM